MQSFELLGFRLQEDRSKIVERNETLATENLTLKPQLEEKQQELIALVRILSLIYIILNTLFFFHLAVDKW